MLSNTSKYAIRAVIYLAINAQPHQKIGIKKIADDLEIPSPFLGKILQNLVRRKYLSSTKGPHGGFGVGKDPYQISLYDIITEMEGDDLYESCILGSGKCNHEHDHSSGFCAIHQEFEEAKKKLVDLYKNTTIGELAEKASEEIDKIIL